MLRRTLHEGISTELAEVGGERRQPARAEVLIPKEQHQVPQKGLTKPGHHRPGKRPREVDSRDFRPEHAARGVDLDHSEPGERGSRYLPTSVSASGSGSAAVSIRSGWASKSMGSVWV